jgi:hypothetical protein
MTTMLLRRHRRRSTTIILGNQVAPFNRGRVFIRETGQETTVLEIARGVDYTFLLAGSAIELRDHLKALLELVEGGTG